MLGKIKKLGVIFTLRDLRATAKAERKTGQLWKSRRFRGACVAAAAAILGVVWAVDIDAATIADLTRNVDAIVGLVADNWDMIVSALGGIWGFIMFVVGVIRRKGAQ
jgi:hypothetical protein